jgi:hypothetical protein
LIPLPAQQFLQGPYFVVASEMRTKATLAIGLCVAFLTILSALHGLEPEFNPPHLISEYQLGRFGWLMSLAFFLSGNGFARAFRSSKASDLHKIGTLGDLGVADYRRRLFLRRHLPS